MNATTFDSLSCARRLKAAGLEENQAEAIAEIMYETIAANREKLLTKSDLAASQTDFNILEMQIKAEIAFAFDRITLTMLAAMGALFAALKLF